MRRGAPSIGARSCFCQENLERQAGIYFLQKMDPQMRKLLEVSWEAWMDSGIDVNQLRGSSRVGVYIGCCGSEVPFTVINVWSYWSLDPSCG